MQITELNTETITNVILNENTNTHKKKKTENGRYICKQSKQKRRRKEEKKLLKQNKGT